MAERSPLSEPRSRRRRLLPKVTLDSEAFGEFAEAAARFMGTGKFIAYMTVFVGAWVIFNVVGIYGFSWDPYPFILLNLFFSTQASYSAPLILLAQNRQDDRDRVTAEQDRQRAQRNLEDTEFLTREIASLRLAMNEVATRDFVRSELRDMLSEILAEERRTREEIASEMEPAEEPDGRGDGRRPPSQAQDDG